MDGITSTIVTRADLANQLAALRAAILDLSPRLEQTDANRAYIAGALSMLDTVAQAHGIQVERRHIVGASEPWRVELMDLPTFEMIGRE